MHASYLRNAIVGENRKAMVELALKEIKAAGLLFDSIAVRGVSGASVSGLFAYLFGVNVCVVRKPEERRNSDNMVETPLKVDRYLILDDFVSSGRTVYAIFNAMKRSQPQAKCVGIYQYSFDHQPIRTVCELEVILNNYRRIYKEDAMKIDAEIAAGCIM